MCTQANLPVRPCIGVLLVYRYAPRDIVGQEVDDVGFRSSVARRFAPSELSGLHRSATSDTPASQLPVPKYVQKLLGASNIAIPLGPTRTL